MPQNGTQVFPSPKKPMAAPITVIATGGTAVVVVTGPIRGGYVQNPSGDGQGIGATPESLFVDMVNTPGSTAANAFNTTSELAPGSPFALPPLQPGVQVKANAATTGHQFTAVVW